MKKSPQPGDADQGERDMRWHRPEDALTVVDEGNLKLLSEAPRVTACDYRRPTATALDVGAGGI
jgi:hypothetical protein